MRANESLLGDLPSVMDKHLDLHSPAVYRSPENLAGLTTWTNTESGFASGYPDLLLPIGAVENPLASVDPATGQRLNFNATEFGWRNTAHSDHKDLPYTTVWSWYVSIVKRAIAIGQE